MNTPYVKQYNELGELINPINGKLTHKFSNRRERNAKKKAVRFVSNAKACHLVVYDKQRFRKRVQLINTGSGVKQIIHYDLLKK